MDFTATEYLKIDIANSFGMDKLSFNDRLSWFNENELVLEKLVNQADEPACYLAGVCAYRDAMKGNPIGYMISLDATSSGMQILSCLIGDIKTASLVNLVNTGKREDAYMTLYKVIEQKIGSNPLITREKVKKAIMTAFYGSSKVPKDTFGDFYPIFENVLRIEAPLVWALNEVFLDIWDNTALTYKWKLPDNFEVNTPVLKVVREETHINGNVYEFYHKENLPEEKGRSLGANITHSVDGFIVRELTMRASLDHNQKKRCKSILTKRLRGIKFEPEDTNNRKLVKSLWDNYLRTNILSARIFYHLDKSNVDLVDPKVLLNLLITLPENNFNILPIHDCFKIHPNYGNELRQLYRQVLSEIANSYLLEDIFLSLGHNITTNREAKKKLSELILDSEYAIC